MKNWLALTESVISYSHGGRGAACCFSSPPTSALTPPLQHQTRHSFHHALPIRTSKCTPSPPPSPYIRPFGLPIVLCERVLCFPTWFIALNSATIPHGLHHDAASMSWHRAQTCSNRQSCVYVYLQPSSSRSKSKGNTTTSA
jgi:hypothetical protein